MKLFAIIDKNNIVIDGWSADSYKEAQEDNPDKTVIEVTSKNSPFAIGKKYTQSTE